MIERSPMQAAAYSNPLPCETCANCLEPIEGMSRARNIFCAAYTTLENRKPAGVLWGNEKCPNYEKEEKNEE